MTFVPGPLDARVISFSRCPLVVLSASDEAALTAAEAAIAATRMTAELAVIATTEEADDVEEGLVCRADRFNFDAHIFMATGGKKV